MLRSYGCCSSQSCSSVELLPVTACVRPTAIAGWILPAAAAVVAACASSPPPFQPEFNRFLAALLILAFLAALLILAFLAALLILAFLAQEQCWLKTRGLKTYQSMPST
jgi:sterol desaturase/sphingolipid hydroxylase (fatty acid hydroxylase superfamily)